MNYALASQGAVATQSSNYNGASASRANDGNVDPDYYNRSVSHTNNVPNSWWQVDFGQTRSINRIILINRDSYQQRLSNFRISVLDAAGAEIAGQNYFTSTGYCGASLTWDLPSPVSARKVKVQLLGNNLEGNGILALAEVQVSEYVPLPVDFALASQGSTATQSNTYSTAAASRAIDGNLNGDYNAGSVAHTNDGTNSWLMVDFGQDRAINRIVLHNRNSYQTRLSNFRISALNSAGSEVSGADFFTFAGNAGDSFLWNLPATVTARKIRIQFLGKNRDNNGYLSLAEVQAFLATPRSDTHTPQLIPSCYLASLAPDPLDADDDNLPDAWESQYGLNNTSALGKDGEFGDFDNDGIPNFVEYQLGSNPSVKDALADGLTRERWFDISGAAVSDLTSSRTRFLREPNERLHVPGVNESLAGDNTATRYRGMVIAPVTGDYTFWISGDNEAELWLADGSVSKTVNNTLTPLTNRYGKIRIASVVDDRFGTVATTVNDFERYATQRSRTIALTAGHSYYIEVLHKQSNGSAHVELAWQVPGSPRVIIPASAFTSDIPENDDLDDDNLPAAWESRYGLNPADNGITDARDGQYGDWDNDGLTNFEEYQLGTDPKKDDSDGDGLTDKDERDYYHSDPLASNLLATTLHTSLDPAAFTGTSVPWETRADGSILAYDRRGWTDYAFTIMPGEEGVYEALVTGGAEGGAVRSEEELPLSFHLDGEMLARQTMRCLLGRNTTLKQMTPWLAAGVHSLRIWNHNTRADCRLRLNSITINRLGGADGNSNGIPDWVEQKLGNENCLTRIPAESRTSPVCVEGVTSSLTALAMVRSADGSPASVSQEVLESVNHGFYANIPLDPAAETTVGVSFQNGAKLENHSIIWTATNILAQGSISLRKGDSLKLTAYAPGQPATGTFTLGGQASLPVIPTGPQPADQPVIVTFDTPGPQTLTATWTPPDGSPPRSATLTVQVATADFGPSFDIQAYNRRTWTLAGVNGMTIETNNDIVWNESTAAGSASRSFVVDVYETGTSHVIARLPATGDIIARGTIEAFSIYNAGETDDAQLVEIRADGSHVYRFTVVADHLPPNAEIRLRTYFQGAIFGNGSRDLVLHASDFDARGVANIFIEWGDATPHRICHTMRTFLVD